MGGQDILSGTRYGESRPGLRICLVRGLHGDLLYAALLADVERVLIGPVG